MPELSRFYGISIKVEVNDHNPPHFHAVYSGTRVTVHIDDLVVRGDRFPVRASRLVREWARLHQDELMDAWERMRNGEQPGKIDPLP